MAKWSGKIGFADTVETEPGIWEEIITERLYYGDLTRNFRKTQGSDNVNDNINISNSISIIADPYANQNLYAMRYIEFQGAKWKVTDAEVQHPRIILTLGGLWNERQT